MTPRDISRIVAIEPSSKGFGFAVLERPTRLLDWGVVRVKGRENTERLKRIDGLIARYQPDFVVLQDTRVRDFRQGTRGRALIRTIRALTARRHIQTRCISWRTVRDAIAPTGRATKHSVAAAIAARFPELASRLPPPRKPWMSADERLAMFDAVAFAVVAQPADSRRSPPPSRSH